MNTLMEYENLDTIAKQESPSASNCRLEHPALSTAEFVERCFIPNYVALKTQAGRTHYHAILKHILRPENVDRMLLPFRGRSNSRLKSIPEWPYLDEIGLCDIAPAHVRRLTSLAESHGYSPQTVKHIKNVISAIFSYAKKEGICSGDNPIAEVQLPPIVHKASPHISLVEAKAIFRMMGYPERQIALLIFNSTMNVSEVCGLRWSYVNLSLRALYVDGDIIPPRSILVRYQRTSSGLARLSPNRVRTVEIPPPLLDLMSALRRQRSTGNPDDFLFANGRGTPLAPSSILASKLKPIGRRLGIPFSWHTLKEVRNVFLQDLCSRLNAELAAL